MLLPLLSHFCTFKATLYTCTCTFKFSYPLYIHVVNYTRSTGFKAAHPSMNPCRIIPAKNKLFHYKVLPYIQHHHLPRSVHLIVHDVSIGLSGGASTEGSGVVEELKGNDAK